MTLLDSGRRGGVLEDEPSPDQPDRPPADPAELDPRELWARMAPYERLYRRRIIFLKGVIQDSLADDVAASLMALDADSDDDITMVIDSPGGDTYGMFAIHDVVQSLRATVHTRCIGMAASAGGFLLATGTGTRSATANARIMLHQPWGGIRRTTAIDLRTQAEQFLLTRRRMEEILAKRTGHPVDEVRADIDRDLWLSADEAVDYGVIDEVVAAGRR